MTAFQRMNVVDGLTVSHYYRMKSLAARRDRRMNLIREVREGRMRSMFPNHLTEVLGDEGIAIANWIDVVARDGAEVLAPLPALNCAAGAMRTDADKKRAEKKNRIGDWYWRQSKLDVQMLYGADWYPSYGFVPFFIEPDFDCKCPIIQIDDPIGAYYERDRFFNVSVYAKTVWRSIDELAAMYPEFEGRIRSDRNTSGSENGSGFLEVVRWVDDTYVTLFIPSRQGLILSQYAHGFGRPPVYIAARPGISMQATRGQFDDVVFVQLARAIMAGLGLEAAEKAVQAPLIIPNDVMELNIGPDAVIQTANPAGVGRANLMLPPAAFQESQALYQELTIGSRYPDARMGQVNASVITGRGVQAMMGTFDSQLKANQTVFAHALREVTSMAFEMDEKAFPKAVKKVRGTLSGRSYEMTYIPERDINGNYECDITYGFAAGLNPSQAIVMMEQLRGDSIISRGFVRDNLPMDIDSVQEQQEVDVEATRDALKQGLFQYAQALGPMAEQGQDPTNALKAIADVISQRENGVALEDAVSSAFAALQQAQQAAQQAAAEQAQQAAAAQQGAAGGAPGGAPGAIAPPDGQAVGQAGQGPGGAPPIQQLIAGMRGNASSAVLQDTVRRSVPAS